MAARNSHPLDGDARSLAQEMALELSSGALMPGPEGTRKKRQNRMKAA
jgi:hypothetical protein